MHRSKLDFLAHMLETARNGMTREQIASPTCTQPGLVDDSLVMFKDLNLLTKRHHSPVSIVTTEKGHKFLHDCKRLQRQLRAKVFQSEKNAALQVLHFARQLRFAALRIYIIVA